MSSMAVGPTTPPSAPEGISLARAPEPARGSGERGLDPGCLPEPRRGSSPGDEGRQGPRLLAGQSRQRAPPRASLLVSGKGAWQQPCFLAESL